MVTFCLLVQLQTVEAARGKGAQGLEEARAQLRTAEAELAATQEQNALLEGTVAGLQSCLKEAQLSLEVGRSYPEPRVCINSAELCQGSPCSHRKSVYMLRLLQHFHIFPGQGLFPFLALPIPCRNNNRQLVCVLRVARMFCLSQNKGFGIIARCLISDSHSDRNQAVDLQSTNSVCGEITMDVRCAFCPVLVIPNHDIQCLTVELLVKCSPRLLLQGSERRL